METKDIIKKLDAFLEKNNCKNEFYKERNAFEKHSLESCIDQSAYPHNPVSYLVEDIIMNSFDWMESVMGMKYWKNIDQLWREHLNKK